MTVELSSASGTKPLWQLGLDSMCERMRGSTHVLDEDRAYRLAQGMHAVGERPPLREVKQYIAQAWGAHHRWSGDMVWRAWRNVHRKPYRLLRGKRWSGGYLYKVDLLIERHEVQPVTEQRLAAVAEEALTAVARAVSNGDWKEYGSARKALDSALDAIEQLRVLRLGDVDDERALRPRWW